MGYLGPLLETSYLSAQNASQYRQIMRIFYLEYEKMHYQLYKEVLHVPDQKDVPVPGTGGRLLPQTLLPYPKVSVLLHNIPRGSSVY